LNKVIAKEGVPNSNFTADGAQAKLEQIVYGFNDPRKPANIHLTLSYGPFNSGCHLGCHLDYHLTSSVNIPLSCVLLDPFVTTVDDNNRIVSQ
jgi:hypothetical protein